MSFSYLSEEVLSRSHDWSAFSLHPSKGCIEFWIFNISDRTLINCEKWGRRALIHMQRQLFNSAEYWRLFPSLSIFCEQVQTVFSSSAPRTSFPKKFVAAVVKSVHGFFGSMEAKCLWGGRLMISFAWLLKLLFCPWDCFWRQIFGRLSLKIKVEKIQADVSSV